MIKLNKTSNYLVEEHISTLEVEFRNKYRKTYSSIKVLDIKNLLCLQ